MKKHNFFAGPAVLPDRVTEETIKALQDFAGTGISIAQISHRSKQFQAVVDEAQDLFKELLNIPDGYSVLFLGGGASTQFAMIPYNIMKNKAMYLNTGVWATKAMKEAKRFGDIIEVRSTCEKFTSIPKDFEIDETADYLHITTNNTIYGTEIKYDIDSTIPLVADMSSDIFSRPIDVSKYVLIYGGAQKNLGPAGVTFVIVKDEILGKVERAIPTMLNYNTHIDKGSMFNTPPVLPIFMTLQTLKWLKELGGIEKMQQMNQEKANLLYNEIDRNPLFVGTAVKEDRSLMNISFLLQDKYKHLEAEFIEFATSKGVLGIKGHRSVGGFRASTYNALPKESVEFLVGLMQEFEKKHA